MAGHRVSLSLALVCLWLCHASLAVSSAPGQPPPSNAYNIFFLLKSAQCPAPVLANTAPCQPTSYNNAYAYFKGRHIPIGAPTDLNQTTWKTFLNNYPNKRVIGHTVSYLEPSVENNVKAVCSAKGGKVYRGNLCISDQMFTFITVRSKINNGKIDQVNSVIRETKHLILACDKVVNQCLPVHFEGNPYSDTPDPAAGGCKA